MDRPSYHRRILESFSVHPVVALLGPRQCGKTTLSKSYAKDYANSTVSFFDLEDPVDLAKLNAPKLVLSPLTGLIVIDEIQRLPDLFPVIRVLVDQNPEQRYLILGSASHTLIRQSSDSLAGRIGYIEITPFDVSETQDSRNLWIKGGFPRSFLATSEPLSYLWRKSYIRTYLEQDIPNLGFQISASRLRRFWMMLTHYHGQTLNYTEIGRSLDLSDTTVRHYVDILAGTFMVRVLSPWYENIGKRQVKTPKLFLRDSGIFHCLAGIDSEKTLRTHPKLGASWEGFAIEETIRKMEAEPEDCYFWAIHGQAELDLLIVKEGKRYGFEIKFTDKPCITKRMRKAQEVLCLDSMQVIYPGEMTFPLSEDIDAVGISISSA
jgi:predicted AAA+ superfamily ATPase